jgi:hypothetical protein
MMADYSTETGEYKGHKTIAIFEDGKRKISFGVGKAKAILAAIEEIKAFVEDNKDSNNVAVDLDKLTPEQQELVQSFIKK